MINLDYIAAKYAGKVNVSVEGIENTATSALNILHEQGIYALSVWLLEKKEQNKPRLWTNFFEIFLSGNDKNYITQIAFAPATKVPLLYRTEMINDVLHTRPTVFKVVFKQLEAEKNWRWQMSFPISVLGPKELRTFRMNFRRFEPEQKLVWNKFFSSAADCANRMGYVSIKGGNISPREVKLAFKEGRIQKEIGNWFLNKGTISFTLDPNTAEAKMKAGDSLACTKKISVVSGDNITIRWKAEGISLPRCNVQLYSGSKQIGLKSSKTVSTGKNGFEMSLHIPDKVTAFRLYFTSPKAEEFKLGAPSIIIGETKK